ncbi:putative cation chloride cotransporter [Aspergillus lucknowensis]|uniref:Amino acid permease-domain-containing protein n=1 Tax=Aspergillus lucknowensis TaxID=176173 RepID=A0ABR4LTU7_9EURO
MTSSRGDGASESLARRRPNFSTRTAQEDESRLDPSESATAPLEETTRLLNWYPTVQAQSYGSLDPSDSKSRRHASLSNLFGYFFTWWDRSENNAGHDRIGGRGIPNTALLAGPLRDASIDRKDRNGEKSRVSDSSEKFGAFSGVFVPTSLNVLSILMFLRFGFILGQAGLLGMLGSLKTLRSLLTPRGTLLIWSIKGLLAISYTINLVTTMSLSAIATNGTVKGGGAYYLISRSLGPEFGGSIGLVFYLGSVLNTGMNAVGLVDCFTQNFGTESGTWHNFLEEGFWWQYLWGTIVLVLCTGICLAGSSIFSRASNGLLVTLLVATLSIPVSAIAMKPFIIPKLRVHFTGIRLRTLLENLKPQLTKGSAGSQLPGRENFQDLFGILFPATGGIFAGASMSGDLKNPSKSIPKGTLYGLAMTFVLYALVIFAMAATLTRDSLYNNTDIVQIANLSGVVILLGEFATSFFSALMGVIGSAKLLQAIAKDSLLPGLSLFSKGTKKNDEPVYAIIVTFVAAQLTMLFDINQIASFVTMAYLMTFLVMNLACFLLKIGSAPNFRPSFHYFNWQTAAAGTVVCGASMFFVDGVYATGCFGILITLFLLIHYTSPPKPWGDVSQSLIYHQVRKYLLRLKQEHVKFWRPQILLFVNNLDDEFKLVSFCNSLKKGALFVLGHVLVTNDFSSAVLEARRQQTTWTKVIENIKVKAFVNIAVSPAVEWGVRNVVLNSGLGGMRPNIVIIDQFREGKSLAEPFQHHRRHSHHSSLDDLRRESWSISASCQTYITVLEDLLFQLRINVAVAKGFEDLELPGQRGSDSKKYIDLWPIQMSAELNANSETKRNVLTTNFDTYTLILQLGCILNTVPSWKKTYKLRVAVFVEYEIDVEDERKRVEALLDKLRIEAEVLVFWLASGDLKTYQIIVNGNTSPGSEDVREGVNTVLQDEDWWQDVQRGRRSSDESSIGSVSNRVGGLLEGASGQDNRQSARYPLAGGIRKLMQSSKRRRSISSFRSIGGVNLGMQTHRLLDAFVEDDSTPSDSSEESDSEESVSGDERGRAGPHRSIGPQTQDGHLASNSTRQGTVEDGTTRPGIPHIIATSETGSPRLRASPARPTLSRSPSSNRFSSSPIPEAQVNTDEGPGPSIMFVPSSSPPRSSKRMESIYKRPSPSNISDRTSASGYPQQASVPLSFNDIPSRAQHLILNELMAKHSKATAVIFTTLPSPLEGTAESEAASKSYLSDLSVLWQGLPPCLLVHSNSMTVTLNL